jgi:hypothetical protein
MQTEKYNKIHHTKPHHNHLIHFLPRRHGSSAVVRLAIAFKNIFFICVELIIIGESLTCRYIPVREEREGDSEGISVCGCESEFVSVCECDCECECEKER